VKRPPSRHKPHAAAGQPPEQEPTLPGLTYGRATPRLRSAPATTIQIDARNHLDCRATGNGSPVLPDDGAGTSSNAHSAGGPYMNVRLCPATRYTGAGRPLQVEHCRRASTPRNGRSPCRSINSRIGRSVSRGEQGQRSSRQQAGQSDRRWSRRKSGGCIGTPRRACRWWTYARNITRTSSVVRIVSFRALAGPDAC